MNEKYQISISQEDFIITRKPGPLAFEARVVASEIPGIEPVGSESYLRRTFSPQERLEKIQVRAFHLWCQRGCPIGSPEIDWFEALRLEELERGSLR